MQPSVGTYISSATIYFVSHVTLFDDLGVVCSGMLTAPWGTDMPAEHMFEGFEMSPEHRYYERELLSQRSRGVDHQGAQACRPQRVLRVAQVRSRRQHAVVQSTRHLPRLRRDRQRHQYRQST